MEGSVHHPAALRGWKDQRTLHCHALTPPHRPSRRVSAPKRCTKRHASSVALPNGLDVDYVSRADVDFFYTEVFLQRCYTSRGITIRQGDTVIDVGSNIGIFAIFAAIEAGPTGRVIAVEPMPATFRCLESNAARARSWCPGSAPITCVNAGAGDGTASEGVFTFYPLGAGWSTMAPDEAEVASAVEAYLEDALEDLVGLESSRLARVARGLKRALPGGVYGALQRAAVRAMVSVKREVRCPLVTVGDVAAEVGGGEVGVLKVDVERAELAVLRGVPEELWPRIRQVVGEVHEGSRAEFCALLVAQGYEVEVWQEGGLSGTPLYSFAAKRPQ
ncbi:unnamed protein product [Pedinophyceae sp. YPF-701]|nr:unnamed protein product [Pedinophyceae sp. YPF-701]